MPAGMRKLAASWTPDSVGRQSKATSMLSSAAAPGSAAAAAPASAPSVCSARRDQGWHDRCDAMHGNTSWARGGLLARAGRAQPDHPLAPTLAHLEGLPAQPPEVAEGRADAPAAGPTVGEGGGGGRRDLAPPQPSHRPCRACSRRRAHVLELFHRRGPLHAARALAGPPFRCCARSPGRRAHEA